MRVSYWILSNKYIGDPAGRDIPDSARTIAPKQHNSHKFIPNTETSWPYNLSLPSKPHFIKGHDGEIWALRKTSNNKFMTDDYAKHGDFSSQIDDGVIRGEYRFPTFDNWKYAGEGNSPNMYNIIQKMPNFAYITGVTPLGIFLPNHRDTQVNLRVTPRIVEAVDPNKIGYFESKKGNLYNNLRNLMFDDKNKLSYEALAYIDFLSEKGFSIEATKNPGVLGLGVEKDSFIAAYYPKQGFLVAGADFHEIAKNIISRYGLSTAEAIEAMKRAVLFHEIGHVLGIPGDRKSEELQGLLQAEFYAIMAENFKGKGMERVYKALAQEGIDYARTYSRTRFRQRHYGNKTIDNIISNFKADGIALGKSGKELDEYVKSRVRDTYGALLEDEPSYELNSESRQASKQNKKSSSRKKSLEEIADEDTELVIVRDKNKVANYDGHLVYGDGDAVELKIRGKDSKDGGTSEKTYERKIDKSEYKSMSDAKEAAEASN